MFEREPEKPHFAKIAVLMFAVLVVSTGAAWLLVAGRDRGSARGATIVRELQDRGLGSFWTGPQVRWYLSTYSGRIIGWSASVLAPDGADYHGLEVAHLLTSRGPQTKWERWTLNASATTGAYRAGLVVRDRRFPDRLDRLTDTVIGYAEGKVTLVQTVEDLRATSPAPENYIPEGSLKLVCLLASQQGRRAYFHMVFNERKPVGGQIDYGTIMLEPVDPASVGISGTASAVRLRTWVPRQEDRLMAFDPQGRLLGEVEENFRRTAVDESEVRRSFADAGELVIQLARSLEVPLAPPPPGPKPPEAPSDELTIGCAPPNGMP